MHAPVAGVSAGELRQLPHGPVTVVTITSGRARELHCDVVGREAALLSKTLQARGETIEADYEHLPGNQGIGQLRQMGESLVPLLRGRLSKEAPCSVQCTIKTPVNHKWKASGSSEGQAY